jgi:hypothetical protein
MRRTTIGTLAAGALALALGLAACGGGGSTFANNPRPPIPINLSVYIDDAKVSISPSVVGAGPIVFVVTNQSSRTETLTVAAARRGTALATTGPISPQATAQVTVDVERPGRYTVATTGAAGSARRTEASLANSRPTVRYASLHVGPKRPSASGALLLP